MESGNDSVFSPITTIVVSVLVSCICTVGLIKYLTPEPDRIAVLNLRVGLSGEQGEELISRAKNLARAGYVVINSNQLAAWPSELEMLPLPSGQVSE